MQNSIHDSSTRASTSRKFVLASRLEIKAIDWLFFNFIARGVVTFLAGPPNFGKSHIALEFAGLVSRGGPDPFKEGRQVPKGRVVLYNVEDLPAQTLKPRLSAVGAVEKRISLPHPDASSDLTVDDFLKNLEREIARDKPAKLLVIDTLGSVVMGFDSRNSEGQLVNGLSVLAKKYNTAVVIVTHVRKSSSGNVLSEVLGATPILGRARCVVTTVSRGPDRFLTTVKGNLTKVDLAIPYLIDSVDLDGSSTSRVKFGKPVPASDLGSTSIRVMTAANEKSIISNILAGKRWMLSTKFLRLAKEGGVNEKKARKFAGELRFAPLRAKSSTGETVTRLTKAKDPKKPRRR